MRALLLLIVVSGCGSVEGHKVDARPADTASADTAIDAPAVPPAAVSAYGTATFAAPSTTFTKVVFTTEQYDDRDEYDPTTGRFTSMHGGDYLVCASVYIPNVYFEIDLYKNNVRGRAFGVSTGVAGGCQPVRLAAGDYIEVWLYQYGSSSVTINDSPEGTWLTISQVNTIVDAQNVGSTNVPTGTFVKVPHHNEIFDMAGEYDNAQATFTPSQPGDYQFCSWLTWNTTSYGGEIDLFVNGAREKGLGDQRGACGGCRTLRLAANDVVDIRMWQGTGNTVTVPEDPNWDWLVIGKLPALVSAEGITTFSAPSQTFVKVPYAREIFDDDGRFDIGTSTFTAASAGDYLFCASLYATSAAADVELDLFKNGVRDRAIAWGRNGIGGCRVLRLAVADQIDVRVWHNNAEAVSFSTDAYWPWFQTSQIR
jgi:hypothetical protein